MFIKSVLLLLATVIQLHSRQDIDNVKNTVYHYQDLNHYDSAHFVIDKAIRISKEINYEFGEAKSIFIKSYLHRCDNELGESFLLNLRALKLLTGNSDDRTPETLIGLYINTGEILKKHFKYSEAQKYYELGLKIALLHNIEKRAAEIYYSLGQIERKKGNLGTAKKFIDRSLSLSLEITDEWTILNSYNLLGLIAQEAQSYNEARSYFSKILKHKFESENELDYKGMAWLNIGESYLSEKKYEQALRALETSLTNYEAIKSPSDIFNVQLIMAEFYYKRERYSQSKHIGLLAISNYEHTTKSSEQYKLFNLLTDVSFELQHLQDAREFHNRFVEENESFLNSQHDLIQLSEQYKMEMLTANFFKDIEKQEQMAQLNQIIYLLLGLGLISFVFFRAKKYLLKRSLEQAFREVTQKKNLYL